LIVGVVETNVLVDLLRNYTPAVSWFAAQGQVTLAVSPLIRMELVSGAQNRSEQRRAIRLLTQFEMLHITPEDQDWAMEKQLTLSLSHGVSINDCLIAAVSYRLQVPLQMRNLKHFTPLLGTLAQRPY
jgi:predicted nucleic acid-binding protein